MKTFFVCVAHQPIAAHPLAVRRRHADDALSDALRSNLTRLIAYAKSADPDLQRQVAEKLANEAVKRRLSIVNTNPTLDCVNGHPVNPTLALRGAREVAVSLTGVKILLAAQRLSMTYQHHHHLIFGYERRVSMTYL